MNIEALIQEKTEQFEKITMTMNQKDEAHQAEMTELQNELLRLQGEYRILTKLKEDSETADLSESLKAEIIEE